MLEETPSDYAPVRVFAGNLPYKRAGLRRYVSRSGSSIGSCRRLLPDDGQFGNNQTISIVVSPVRRINRRGVVNEKVIQM